MLASLCLALLIEQYILTNQYLCIADSLWHWQSIDDSVVLPSQPSDYKQLTEPYDLCLTGEVRGWFVIHTACRIAIIPTLGICWENFEAGRYNNKIN